MSYDAVNLRIYFLLTKWILRKEKRKRGIIWRWVSLSILLLKSIKGLQTWVCISRQLLPNIFKTLNEKLQFLLHQWHPYNATNQLIMSTASTSRRMTNNITIASAATSPTRSKVSSKATITARLHQQWRRCTTLPMLTTASQLGQRRRRNTTRIKKEVCFIRSRMPFLTTAVTAAVTVIMKVTKPITTRR